MKKISTLNLPDDLLYTEDHEWAKQDGDCAKIGISDYAQDQLGDIVFVELPELGSSFHKSEEFGVIESVKAVAELYMPVSGEVTAVNEDLNDNPKLINHNACQNWIIKVKLSDPGQLDTLMNKKDYLKFLER
ncbi:glycine cleavage system protein GcvH [bacterium]|nr:glycine cleavage system protein GcvH [bacterium]